MTTHKAIRDALPELPVPTCFAWINKHGDVTSTHKNRDSWRTNPLYTADQMRAYALQAVEALRREPMTEEQAEALATEAFGEYMCDINDDIELALVRKVETYHHITQKEQGK